MEDSGLLEIGKEKELMISSVKSILATEKVEHYHGLDIPWI